MLSKNHGEVDSTEHDNARLERLKMAMTELAVRRQKTIDAFEVVLPLKMCGDLVTLINKFYNEQQRLNF